MNRMTQFGEIQISNLFGGYQLIDATAEKMPTELSSALGVVFANRPETVIPVYYFGKQIVNGTNHMLVCRRIREIDNSKKIDYVRIEIYIPMGADGYKRAELKTMEVSSETMYLPEIKRIFEEGTKYLIGVSYKAMLYVGAQLVKGMDYHFICETEMVRPGSEPYLTRVILNEYEGKITIAGIDVI